MKNLKLQRINTLNLKKTDFFSNLEYVTTIKIFNLYRVFFISSNVAHNTCNFIVKIFIYHYEHSYNTKQTVMYIRNFSFKFLNTSEFSTYWTLPVEQ